MDNQDKGQQPLRAFPTVRMRRLRYNPAVRRICTETRLHASELILPLFVRPGKNVRREIESMPGHYQLSPDRLAEEINRAADLGLGGAILFGIPEKKDPLGSDSTDPEGIIPQALHAARQANPGFLLITDVCFCEYTDHGQCGVFESVGGRPDVNNDATLELLARQAVVHAQAGADMLAPSGMMDGMVCAIRSALDANGFSHIPIMSYAAKYASSFYGPFRDAAESAPQSGNRLGYQMDPSAAAEQALAEVELDLGEGADIVMVKPALPYLDIIRLVHGRYPQIPLAAYNVSGEFSMIKAAAARGWLDEKAAALESLTAIKRAGASIIITYWAKAAAGWVE